MKKIQKPIRTKPWIRYCFMAAAGLLLLAAVLYGWMYMSIDREFGFSKAYFGEVYSELFELKSPDKTMKKTVETQAEEAFSFVGSRQEAEERFGALAGYCALVEQYPEAVSVDFTLDILAGDTEGNTGYLWVAYTQRIYDAEGELLAASGSEDHRCLARWTVQKTEGVWQVTEIRQNP